MNRREFLKLMGITAAGMAAPKLIFDMGANLYKYDKERELQEAAQLVLDKMREYLIQSGSIRLHPSDLIDSTQYVWLQYVPTIELSDAFCKVAIKP